MNKLLPNHQLLLLFLLIFVDLSSNPAIAEQDASNWYTVEVITFTRAKSSQIQENWLNSLHKPGHSFLKTSASDINQSDMQIKPVPESQWQLSRHAYSLGKDRGIRVRSHQAWRQPGLPKNASPWIELQSNSSRLTGKVRISLSRYLHAEVDIRLLNPDWNPDDSSDSQNQPEPAKNIYFQASRKLKLDKIHYIDHPLAGVLIKIERFKIDQPQANSSDKSSS